MPHPTSVLTTLHAEAIEVAGQEVSLRVPPILHPDCASNVTSDIEIPGPRWIDCRSTRQGRTGSVEVQIVYVGIAMHQPARFGRGQQRGGRTPGSGRPWRASLR